jgi:hypothetical protein
MRGINRVALVFGLAAAAVAFFHVSEEYPKKNQKYAIVFEDQFRGYMREVFSIDLPHKVMTTERPEGLSEKEFLAWMGLTGLVDPVRRLGTKEILREYLGVIEGKTSSKKVCVFEFDAIKKISMMQKLQKQSISPSEIDLYLKCDPISMFEIDHILQRTSASPYSSNSDLPFLTFRTETLPPSLLFVTFYSTLIAAIIFTAVFLGIHSLSRLLLWLIEGFMDKDKFVE